MPPILVIRIRGQPDVRYDIKETLRRLRLHKKYHATLVPDRSEYLGMLKKVENFVTYGYVGRDTLKELILKRGRLIGNKPVDPDKISEAMGMDFDVIIDKLYKGELMLSDIKGLKPVFRLHPPRGGFKKSIKKHIRNGGELGRREDIDKLVLRMI